MMFVIQMKNCAFYARHGALPEEERLGQRFYIDATLTVDAMGAALKDDLEGTVHYGIAFETIEKIVTQTRRNLIECLAADIGRALCEEFPQIVKAEITVRKPSAPIIGILDYVQVTVSWPN